MSRIISTFLSLVILLGSSGLTYAQHYCGGNEVLAKVTIGERHLDCGMDMDESNCCDNIYTKVDTDDSHAAVEFNFSLNDDFVAYHSDTYYIIDSVGFCDKDKFYIDYSPPPLGIDLYILYETYLI